MCQRVGGEQIGGTPVRSERVQSIADFSRTPDRTFGPVLAGGRTLNWTVGPVRQRFGSNPSSEPNFATTMQNPDAGVDFQIPQVSEECGGRLAEGGRQEKKLW